MSIAILCRDFRPAPRLRQRRLTAKLASHRPLGNEWPMAMARMDRGLAALLAGFAALAAILLGAVWLAERQSETSGWVRHTLEVENRLSRVQTQLLEAEAAQRGYLLTRREDFLAPYGFAANALEPELAGLAQATADNPRQAVMLRKLRAAVDGRAVLLRENLEIARRGEAVPPERLERGRLLMDETRRLVVEMKREEEGLLARRTREAARQATLARIAFMLAGAALVGLGVFALSDGRRRLRLAVES
ncbi:MAG TPA: CHASE3 domain-containing protein, partial [Phenylobacterium sp.]